MINVREYGAVGTVFTTTGRMEAGSHVVRITGRPLPREVRAGSGIGVAGAGQTDELSRPWFPTCSLRARVLSRRGDALELDAPAAVSVADASVYIDDSLPIQRALDDAEAGGGGEVVLHAGVFVIGTPNAKTNQPLYVGSQVTLKGAGIDSTIIRVCDRAVQLSAALDSNEKFAGVPHGVYLYPFAAGIVNSRNLFWHKNRPYETTHATHANDPLTLPNYGGRIQDLTVDGNMFNQPLINPGNRTNNTVQDSRAMTFVDAVSLAGSPAPDRLKNGHTYFVGQTFLDREGRETSSGGNAFLSARIPDEGDYQLAIRSVTPPVGAVGSVIYYIDYADCNYGRGGWHFPDPAAVNGLWVWNRVVLDHLPAPGEIFTVDHYTPAPAEAETRPPMGHNSSVSLLGYKSASSDYGIFLDNVDGFSVERVKVKDFGLDGIALGSPEFGWLYWPEHPVRNIEIKNVIVDRALRACLTVLGSADRVLFDRLETRNAPQSIAIEVDVSTPGITGNMTWRNCTFHGGTDGAPIILATFENHPAPGLRFEDCLLDRVRIAQSGVGRADLMMLGCKIQDTYDTAIASRGGDARFLLANMIFERCGKLHPPEPDNFTGDSAAGILMLSSNGGETNMHHCHATLVNSLIIQPEEDPTQYLVYVQDKIENNPDARAKLVFVNNSIVGNWKARLLVGGTDYVIDDIDPSKTEILPAP